MDDDVNRNVVVHDPLTHVLFGAVQPRTAIAAVELRNDIHNSEGAVAARLRPIKIFLREQVPLVERAAAVPQDVTQRILLQIEQTSSELPRRTRVVAD